jgi:hypothetical protein
MNPLSREAIATAPELTKRTPFAVVVDAFLVRATDDAIRHRNGQHSMPVHEFQNLSRYAGVGADVTMIDFPVSAISAFSHGTIPTATLVAWFRFGP